MFQMLHKPSDYTFYTKFYKFIFSLANTNVHFSNLNYLNVGDYYVGCLCVYLKQIILVIKGAKARFMKLGKPEAFITNSGTVVCFFRY